VTAQSLKRLFGKLGLDVAQDSKFQSKNAAAVIVTSKLPPFSRIGTKIDIKVSSIGDASSLEGGTLLVTPLRGGDQNVYAVAQGAVTLGGEVGKSSKFPTVGRVVSGATIEKDVEVNFTGKNSLRLSLNRPDFTTTARMAAVVNGELGGQFATARDGGTVDVVVPFSYENKTVELMALLENINVNVDTKAQVILNERTGTLVMGGQVSLLPVGISHGDLSIKVEGGNNAEGQGQSLLYVKDKANVSDLIKVLNALGTTPKDLTAIFQTLKRLGALQADLEIM